MTGWAAAVAAAGWVAAALVCARCRLAEGERRERVARALHELRGPLAATRLGLESAARRGRSDRDRLRALELELARAALALEDLGAAHRDGTAPQRPELVDVAALVDDCVAAAGDGCAARVAASGAADVFVAGDRIRIAQAIGNLIENAVEHGGGSAAVAVVVRDRDRHARVEVSDAGPGLPAPVAELIRRPRRGRGTRGRGLAIAAGVATSHGGRLSAAPTERGARLVLELPLARRASAASSAQSE